jgi:hypothetical protein
MCARSTNPTRRSQPTRTRASPPFTPETSSGSRRLRPPIRPLFVTDRRNDGEQLARDAPVSRAGHVIDRASLERLGQTLTDTASGDTLHDERLRMRRFYFGDIAVGESTNRFTAAIDELIAERDTLAAERAELDRARNLGAADVAGSTS